MRKSNLKEKETKLEELLTKANDNPMIKRILEEEAKATMAKRVAAAEQLVQIEKERDATIPLLLSDTAVAEKAFLAAKAAFESAGQGLNTARSAKMQKSQQFQSSINHENEILLESCDPQIDAAIVFFNKKLAYFRSPGRISSQKVGAKRNIFSMKKTTKATSNCQPVKNALLYCQGAIKALETMKLEPTLDVERIEEMKTAIPDISQYVEIDGEKSMPEQSGKPIFPSAAARNITNGRLLERVGDLLKR